MDNPRDIQRALQASVALHVILFLSVIGLTYAGGQEKRRGLMEVEITSPVTTTPTMEERPRQRQRVEEARSPIVPPVLPVKREKEVALPAPPPKPRSKEMAKQRNSEGKHPKPLLPAVQQMEPSPVQNDMPPAPKVNPEPPTRIESLSNAPPINSNPTAANASGSGGGAAKPAVLSSPSGTPSGHTGGSGSGGGAGSGQPGSGTGSAGARVIGAPSGEGGGTKGGSSGSGGQSVVVKEAPKPPPPPRVETPVPPPPPTELKREEPRRDEPSREAVRREEPQPELRKREEPLMQAKPKYRRNPKPDYPPDARRQKQEGVVYLLVSIDARGRVEEVQVERSSGFELLDEAALKAVRQWEFEPARRGDTPVATRVRVPIRFKLE